MDSVKSVSRVLGIAFLFQFITSSSSGFLLQPAFVVPGDIDQTLLNVASNSSLMATYILVDMLTAMGIVFLGVMLFVTLRKQNETVALVALGLYVVEAALLATSRMATFWLVRIGEAYVVEGQPAYLQTMGNLALESMDYVGLTLHVLVFCVGAVLFYTLLYQSRVIPRALSLWGLITVIPLFFAMVAVMLGYQVPVFLYLPYYPFEFVAGLWILIKGLNVAQEDSLVLEPA